MNDAQRAAAARFVVVVEHNLVSRIAQSDEADAEAVGRSPLEISTRLALNYRTRGSLDGRYYFDELPQARVFATLCLEFMRALADRRLTTLKTLPAGAQFDADADPAAPAMPGSMR